MKDDETTTVGELKLAIDKFVTDRDWHQFHDPKSLAMAVATEVGELMEHFRWATGEESFRIAKDAPTASAVASEFADVMILALELAMVCEIDVASTIAVKLEHNAQRYPINKAKGSNKKYDQL